MKFVSTKSVNGTRLTANVPLDSRFIEHIRVGDDGDLIFDYDLSCIKTPFPIAVSDAYIVAALTPDNIFLTAAVNTAGKEELPAHQDYLNDFDNLDCEIEITDDERHKLMLLFLNELCGKTAAGTTDKRYG